MRLVQVSTVLQSFGIYLLLRQNRELVSVDPGDRRDLLTNVQLEEDYIRRAPAESALLQHLLVPNFGENLEFGSSLQLCNLFEVIFMTDSRYR